jgi:hypothetical protein
MGTGVRIQNAVGSKKWYFIINLLLELKIKLMNT